MVLTIGLILLGCTTAYQRQPVATYLPTHSFEPDVALTALVKGRLVVRNGCVRIVGRGGGKGTLVIWPTGSRLTATGRGQSVAVGGSGSRLKLGTRVRLGGGGGDNSPPLGLTAQLPAPCAGPYFSAN